MKNNNKDKQYYIVFHLIESELDSRRILEYVDIKAISFLADNNYFIKNIEEIVNDIELFINQNNYKRVNLQSIKIIVNNYLKSCKYWTTIY